MDKSKIHNLYCSVLQPKHGNCSNHGVSYKFDSITVYMKRHRESHLGDAIAFSMAEAQQLVDMYDWHDDECLAIQDPCCGMTRFRVIPANLFKEGKWTMMGGCYAETSDSRWFQHPIPIHDRVES
jgi:hypothetical protein